MEWTEATWVAVRLPKLSIWSLGCSPLIFSLIIAHQMTSHKTGLQFNTKSLNGDIGVLKILPLTYSFPSFFAIDKVFLFDTDHCFWQKQWKPQMQRYFKHGGKDSRSSGVILPVNFPSVNKEENTYCCVRHSCGWPSPSAEHEDMSLVRFPPFVSLEIIWQLIHSSRPHSQIP